MTARITSIDNAIIKNPTLKVSDDNNTYTLSLPQQTGTLATVPMLQSIQTAIRLIAMHPTYPSTFLPLSQKMKFTGWDNITWVSTSFDTFKTYLTTTGTGIITPNGISLTSITANGISSTINSIADCSVILGTTKLPKQCANLFAYCEKLKTLDLYLVDTSIAINMSNMFSGCKKLTAVDVSNFNTSKTSIMSYMFNYCSSLITLDLSNFNTSNTTNMSYMFKNCTSLITLNISNFRTANLSNATDMFANCTALNVLICTKETLDKLISLSSGLTNTDTIGSDITDTDAHTWTIYNLNVISVL